jgi:[ribosomal protein S5]-alanine N-acetyltransferase
MTQPRRSIGHPSLPSTTAIRLYGRRVVLRPLVPQDFSSWSEIRRRNEAWLLKWEPLRPPASPDPARDRDAFAARCSARDRERQLGQSYAFGLFVDNALAGEINLNNVQRGALQSATVGYWIDEARAGQSYTPESVVVLLRFGFEELHLHRVEICIIPRNSNSRRVMDKLRVRDEGVAQRFLEIAGVWEDHVRYAMTVEEWIDRRDELRTRWL